MKFIWLLLAIAALGAAFYNIYINVLVLLRIRLTYDCVNYLSEYIMLTVIMLALLNQILSPAAIILILILSAVIWQAVTMSFRKKRLHFIRVYGIQHVMHTKISQMLAQSAQKYGLDRTRVYIYGGDHKTPCNTIIFRSVKKKVRMSILSDIEYYLKRYVTVVRESIISLILDAAAIYIIFAVLL